MCMVSAIRKPVSCSIYATRVHVCMYVSKCVHMCTFVSKLNSYSRFHNCSCVHARMYVSAHKHMHTHKVYLCILIGVIIYACTHVCMCINTHVHTRTCVTESMYSHPRHIHLCMCARTYVTHTCTHAPASHSLCCSLSLSSSATSLSCSASFACSFKALIWSFNLASGVWPLFIWLHVCMLCFYTHTHTYIHTYIYTNIYAQKCTYILRHTHTYTHTCLQRTWVSRVYVYAWLCVYTCIQMYACWYWCMLSYVRTSRHIQKHKRTHSHSKLTTHIQTLRTHALLL
jgi:hypothetical protein